MKDRIEGLLAEAKNLPINDPIARCVVNALTVCHQHFDHIRLGEHWRTLHAVRDQANRLANGKVLVLEIDCVLEDIEFDLAGAPA